MSSFLRPEEMNAVQKMKYMSTVSKVCKEMETHLGFSEKTVAEVFRFVYCISFSYSSIWQ